MEDTSFALIAPGGWCRAVVKLGVTEEADAVPHIPLDLSEFVPHVRVEGERWVLTQNGRQDQSLMPDLLALRPTFVRHLRNWHPPRVEVLSIGEMDVVLPCRLVVLVEKLGQPHVDVDAVALLLFLGLRGPGLVVVLGLLERPRLAHHADEVLSVV
jgi:hypothetical protein